jgi:hypothetical protein
VGLTARDLPDELRNFAAYSRSVAGDTVGPARLTWTERAEWADACATAAEGAVEALTRCGRWASRLPPKGGSSRMGTIERRECGRCGTEVRAGKRTHFCGEPYPLTVTEDIQVVEYVPRSQLEGAVDTVTHAIVMLVGLAEPWDALDHAERSARAEGELRALLDRLGGQ